MNLFTRINIPSARNQIEHFYKIAAIGSCFAENIGSLLVKNRFKVLNNPFGTLYNPHSILNSLQLLQNIKNFKKEDLIYYDNEYHSFYYHSNFSSDDYAHCLDKINSRLSETVSFIKEAAVLVLTFGTACFYKHKKQNIIVSNCHKMPIDQFERSFIKMEAVETIFEQIINLARQLNPEIKIIFTLSPVRYWASEAIENQLSKAVLLWGINRIYKKNEFVDYFPAYEIMLDELRDYRFYKSDLIHPTEQAIDYIWEKFSKNYFTAECQSIVHEVEKINQACNHKPRNINSKQYKDFILKQIAYIKELKIKYSHLSLDSDLRYFNEALKNFL